MNYKRSKIYTIRSHQTDKIYIGSTTSSLAKRFHSHKEDYKSYISGGKHYITSFEILQYEDAYIELLEEYPCENKMNLHRREGELIRENNCVNKFVAGRTKKEYSQDNKEHLLEYQKQHYEQNKEQILEQQKQYREQNKDKINEQQRNRRKQIKNASQN